MNFEAIIYGTGVATMMAVLLVIIVCCVHELSVYSVKNMTKQLGRVYRHVQLVYIMGLLKEKGYAQCLKDIEEEKYPDEPKEF